MPGDHPIGGDPPPEICAPCSTPPESPASLLELQRQLCDLRTNYQNVLLEYQATRKTSVAQGQEINSLRSSIASLTKQINGLNSGSCSRLGPVTTADAIIVCEGGQQKTFRAPSVAGQVLSSFIDTDGNQKWQFITPPDDFWNWGSSAATTVYNGSILALNGLVGDFNFGVAPASARELLLFIDFLQENTAGAKATWQIFCNGIIAAGGGHVDNSGVSYQAPQADQIVVPVKTQPTINSSGVLAGGSGGILNFSGSSGGGTDCTFVMTPRIIAWR